MTRTFGRFAFGPAIVALVLFGAGSLLSWVLIAYTLEAKSQAGYDVPKMVLFYSTLPRLATALLAGAALSLAGALLQQVLRNPLADPTTLGISAGANLALVVATLFFPGLLGLGRDLVALAGSAVVACLVMGLGARRGFRPFRWCCLALWSACGAAPCRRSLLF